jgi:hypothetical protein
MESSLSKGGMRLIVFLCPTSLITTHSSLQLKPRTQISRQQAPHTTSKIFLRFPPLSQNLGSQDGFYSLGGRRRIVLVGGISRCADVEVGLS